MIARLIKKYPERMAFYCTTLLTVGCFPFLWMGISMVLICYFPAHTVMPDGSIERHEALGQVLLGAVLAAAVAIAMYVLLYFLFLKRFREYNRKRS
jgi:hypothetical protein